MKKQLLTYLGACLLCSSCAVADVPKQSAVDSLINADQFQITKEDLMRALAELPPELHDEFLCDPTRVKTQLRNLLQQARLRLALDAEADLSAPELGERESKLMAERALAKLVEERVASMQMDQIAREHFLVNQDAYQWYTAASIVPSADADLAEATQSLKDYLYSLDLDQRPSFEGLSEELKDVATIVKIEVLSTNFVSSGRSGRWLRSRQERMQRGAREVLVLLNDGTAAEYSQVKSAVERQVGAKIRKSVRESVLLDMANADGLSYDESNLSELLSGRSCQPENVVKPRAGKERDTGSSSDINS